MSISRYKNINEILSSTIPTRGNFFTDSQKRLLSPSLFYNELNAEKFLAAGSPYSKQKVEFHLYSRDGGYIASLPYTSNYQTIDEKNIYFDVQQDLGELGIQSGVYRFVYNLLLDRVGSFATEKLFVYDISPSRTELILKLTNPDDTTSLTELRDFFIYWANETRYFINSHLNFGRNNLISIANISTNNTQNTIYIKLFEPLPADIQVQSTCWISEHLMDPYVDSIEIIPRINEQQKIILNDPEFDIEKINWFRTQTEFKTWTDLLSINPDISELVTTNLFRKKYGVKLNVDFTDLNNFIFYSSAEERILNFVYKLELLSWYQEQIDTVANLNGSHASDILIYSNAKLSILNSFDDFEVFLYYGRDNKIYENSSYPIPPVPKVTVCTDSVPITWIEWAQTWINAVVVWSTGPTLPGNCYLTLDITSPEFIAWKEAAIQTAIEFDEENEAQLVKTIPEFIRDDENNSQYVLFVNMIANYFDTIWMYLKQFNNKYDTQQNPRLGVSNDLISTFAKNLGWNLSETQKAKDLWFYFFGISDDDSFTQKDIFSDLLQLSSYEYTKNIWRRIFFNLPLITKSKGTRRSISALLSAYGIPVHRFFIREYGGLQTLEERPKYKEENVIPYLLLNQSDSVQLPFAKFLDGNYNETVPSSIYLRIIPSETYPTEYTTIINKDNYLFLDVRRSAETASLADVRLRVSSSLGVLSASVNNIDIIDSVPTSIFLQSNKKLEITDTGSIDLYILQSKYEKIKLFDSASISISGSYINSIIDTGSIYINPNSIITKLHEIRYWSNPIDEEIMMSHTLSPLSYHGMYPTSSTIELLGRYPFWLYTAYTTSSTPNTLLPVDIKNNNSDLNYTASISFSVNETGSFYYNNEYVSYEIPTINGVPVISKKERNGAPNTADNLSVDLTMERFANNPLFFDENKLKMGFSPQANVDKDIFNRFGTFKIDEYIGSNIDKNEKFYTDLYDLSEYYGNYSKPDIHLYLKSLKGFDFSIFEQIKQALPAKANSILGIIIENTELQRIKLKTLPNIIGDDISELDKIEITRTSNRTLNINKLSSNILKKSDIFINVETEPVGTINKSLIIKDTTTTLSSTLKQKNIIIGGIGDLSQLSGNIGSFANIFQITNPSIEKRITTFNNRILYSTVTASYSTPIFGGDYNYQTNQFQDENEININSFVNQSLYGYYGKIDYIYDSEVSASILDYTDYNIILGKRGSFIKRVTKGFENNRYVGCKVKSFGDNVINTSTPAQTNVFAIANIPSGSDSVAFISMGVQSGIQLGNTNIEQPSY